MAGGLHHPGGLREQLHLHEQQRQPLLSRGVAGLRPGRAGGLRLHPGEEPKGKVLDQVPDLILIRCCLPDDAAGEAEGEQTTGS